MRHPMTLAQWANVVAEGLDALQPENKYKIVKRRIGAMELLAEPLAEQNADTGVVAAAEGEERVASRATTVGATKVAGATEGE